MIHLGVGVFSASMLYHGVWLDLVAYMESELPLRGGFFIISL